MKYTRKFQAMADAARAQIEEVTPEEVDALLAQGAVALDIRDKDTRKITFRAHST